MKYPKEYLDEIKLRLKVSSVVGKYIQLKKSNNADALDFSKVSAIIRETLK